MSGLNVMDWNAQGLTSKLRELSRLMKVEITDVLCVSETHFSDNTRLNHFEDYHIIIITRQANAYGDLLILVKKQLKFQQ